MYLHGSKFKRHKRIFIESYLFTHLFQPPVSFPGDKSVTDSLGIFPEKFYAAYTKCTSMDIFYMLGSL